MSKRMPKAARDSTAKRIARSPAVELSARDILASLSPDQQRELISAAHAVEGTTDASTEARHGKKRALAGMSEQKSTSAPAATSSRS